MSEQTNNPYIGPRPFKQSDRTRFYGRDREARELLAHVLSQRTLLFFAASGAGKSSLINASLLPELEKRDYEILPTGRVSGVGLPGPKLFPGAADKSAALNVFVYNLKQSLVPLALERASPELRAYYLDSSLGAFLLSLVPDTSERRDEDGDEEPRFTLAGIPPPAPQQPVTTADRVSGTHDAAPVTAAPVTAAPDQTSESLPLKPRCLVIDQFEELFTAYPSAWEQRDDFFRQVRQAQEEDPYLWIVFAMREDYVARLEPYRHLLPGRLAAPYAMQRMGTDAALEAIKRPVDTWLPEPERRPFEPDVAEELVDNLRRVRVPPDQPSEDGTAPGEYVEPVQLQIVCYQMWEGLREYPAKTIARQHLTRLADTDDLADFVSHALRDYYEGAIAGILDDPSVRVSEQAIRDWFSRKLITETGTRGFVQQGSEETGGLPNPVVALFEEKYLVRSETRAGGVWYELTHDRFIDVIVTANEEWNARRTIWISGATRRWQSQGKDDGLLLRGTALVRAERLQRERGDDLKDLERLFIKESVALRNREAIAFQRRKARNQQRLTAGLIALGVAFAITLIAVVVAVWQRVEARNSERQAISGQIAAQARLLLDERLDRSLLLGVAGIQVEDTMAARSSLDAALQHSSQLEAFLWGHDTAIVGLEHTENGSTIASVSRNGTIIHWDTATHQVVREIDALSIDSDPEASIAAVEVIALSPGGATLAIGDAGGVLSLWHVEAQPPTPIRIIAGLGRAESLAFSANGELLATSHEDNAIRLWDVATGKLIATFTGHEDRVTSMAFSLDMRTLASGGADGAILLWDLDTGTVRDVQLVDRETGEQLAPDNDRQTTDWVYSLAFSRDGQILAIGAADSSLTLWMRPSLAGIDPAGVSDLFVRVSQELSSDVHALAFSPDGQFLAIGAADGSLLLVPLGSSEPARELTDHTTGVRALAFSPDSAVLVSGAESGRVILWRTIQEARREHRAASGYGDGAGRIAVSPDGKTLTLHACPPGHREGRCGELQLIDLRRGQLLQDVTLALRPMVSLVFAPGGRQIAGQYDEGLITVWKARNGNWRYDLHPEGPVTGMAFTYYGYRLATTDQHHNVKVWKLRSGESIARYEPTGDSDATVTAFSPNGRLWATGYSSGLVTVRRVRNGKLVQEISHDGSVSALAFGPRSRILAIGDVEGALILRDRLTNAVSFQPTGRQERVSALAFSPNGSQVAVGYADGALLSCAGRVHRAACLPIATLDDSVLDLGFRWDGSLLFALDESHAFTTWDMSAEAWVTQACRAANRSLSEREWTQFGTGAPYQPTCERFAVKEDSDEG